MDRTIEISDELVKAAQEATGETDERTAVERLLRDAVKSKRRPIDGMLDLVGKIQLREGYDYKRARSDDHGPD